MSGAETTESPTGRFRSTSAEPGPVLGALAGVAFWGWLVTRWLNDWVLARIGVGPGAGENFVPREPFDAAAASVGDVSEGLGMVGLPIEWAATLLSTVAIAVDLAPALAGAAWYTIVLTSVSIILGFFIAVPLAVLRVYGGPLKWPALAYTELIRGTPLLAQLFVLYYGLPLAIWLQDAPLVGYGSIPEQAFWIAIIGFTINGSAYQAEYIRGALESVDEGQLTAARAVGLSQYDGIRYVVLPQTLRYAIPAWTNEVVYLIKYSSLAAFITVPELYYVASDIAAQTFEYTAIFGLLAVVYLGIVLTATKIMDRVESHVAIPGIGTADGRKQGDA
ncbi:amino acid ABC transporter permease [Natranaeroarchaeum aerophilus]|uniref:Amino acid ABC transporter permease n=1 Tax=Natranaeroarchaeum aerophilus TaxID=2917711 RepID=A0AAE3K5Q9_9EURY|nr:amino acid ABC transporter permease [Natranaeroarchaeum aerophilus]MCL9814228.1 amino acid ABC transporter permease [Natranaeroarchaeum aerophilus]